MNHLANCDYPYALTPNNTCVNIRIDFNNCGEVGFICNASYKSCSGGVCSIAPAIQLANAIPILSNIDGDDLDDYYKRVKLPFNITLYNTTTSDIHVTSNGVSFLCFSTN